MAISINTNELEYSIELLDSTSGYFNNALENISSATSNTDSEVLQYVSSQLSSTKSNISLLSSQTKNISYSINDAITNYNNIENKAKTTTSKASQVTSTTSTSETGTEVAKETKKKKNIFEKIGGFFSDTGAKIVNGFKSIGKGITNFFKGAGDAVAKFCSKATSAIGGFFKKVGTGFVDFFKGAINVVKRVGASIVNFAVSLVRGIANFVEAIVDVVALAATAVASIVTGLIDLGQWIYGKITGNEWESATKTMWNGVLDFVGTKWVDKGVDYAYTHWGPFKALDEAAYGPFKHDGLGCSIGNGIGYVAGIVILTVVTFGAGGAAVGGSSAAAGAATSAVGTTATATATGIASGIGSTVTIGSAAVSTGQLALTATAAGIGKHTQDARANGAGIVESLTAGTLGGAFEGLQFFVGGEIQASIGGKVAGKIVGESASPIVKSVATHASRITLDGLTGGAQALFDPVEQSIYQKGYYTADGQYIEFSKDATLAEKYAKIFEQNGGWGNVAKQTLTSAAISAVAEGVEVAGEIKQAANANYNGSVKDMVVDKATNLKTTIKDKISETAGNTAKQINSKIGDKLDAMLVKKVNDANNAAFTEAFDSTSNLAKIKALAADTKAGRLATSAKTALANKIDALNVKVLGEQGAAAMDVFGASKLDYAKAYASSALDKISNTKVGRLASSTKTALSNRIDALNVKVLGEQGAAAMDAFGASKLDYAKAYANSALDKLTSSKTAILDRLSASKVGKITSSAKSALSDRLDGLLVKRVNDANNAAFTEAFNSTSNLAKIKALAADTKVGKITTSAKTAVAKRIDALNVKVLGEQGAAAMDAFGASKLDYAKAYASSALDKISNAKSGRLATSAKTALSDRIDALNVKVLGEQGAAAMDVFGASKLDYAKAYANSALDKIANTKVGRLASSTKTALSDRIDALNVKVLGEQGAAAMDVFGASKLDYAKAYANSAIDKLSNMTGNTVTQINKTISDNIDALKLNIKQGVPDIGYISNGEKVLYSVGTYSENDLETAGAQ